MGAMTGRYLVHYLRDRFDWIFRPDEPVTGVPHGLPEGSLGAILETALSEAGCDADQNLRRFWMRSTPRSRRPEALIAKQERVRAGLMQDLFTRGVDEHGQLRPPHDPKPRISITRPNSAGCPGSGIVSCRESLLLGIVISYGTLA